MVLPLAVASLAALDWIVVAIYLLVLLASGIWLARREPSGAREYFLAGRRMPAWAVACSIIASSLSVATFLGAPEQSYRGSLTYLSANIGGLIAITVVAVVFIPAFYRLNVTTVYELLERRFGTGAKHAASAAFMVGRVFASGARVYIASIPLAMLLFGQDRASSAPHLAAAIILLSFVAVVYTLIGGVASIIWTDVLQTIVLLGSVVAAIIVLLVRIPAPIGDIAAALQTAGPAGASKLTIIDPGLDVSKPWFGFDPSAPFTLLTAVLGISLLNLAAYGTDHDMVQRMLTCKSAARGGRSAIAAILISIPIVALFLVVGLLLFVFYDRADLMNGAVNQRQTSGTPEVFMSFILSELPMGVRGLMIAGLFAVGLGSLNSAINAMAATLVSDFYRQMRERARGARGTVVGLDEDPHYLTASRWAVAGWGAVLAAFAIVCIYWKRANPGTGLIDFALGVMNFAYSGLLAVFLCAIFTRRGNSVSAIAALITGFGTVFLMQPAIWKSWAKFIQWSFVTPTSTASRSLADIQLAFPWQMLIATSIALAVCCVGAPPKAGAQRH